MPSSYVAVSSKHGVLHHRKCPWWGGRFLVKLTNVFIKCSHNMLMHCLEAVPVTFWGFWILPVMDLPLYTTVARSALSDLGSAAYQLFDRAVVLKQVMRQSGQSPTQVLFHDILLRLRDARLTENDWEQLMEQTPARVPNVAPFSTALHLHPTVEAVVEHNVFRLNVNGQPIATIKDIPHWPQCSQGLIQGCRGFGINHLLGSWSSCDAYCQPVGGCRTRQWFHGNSDGHLLWERFTCQLLSWYSLILTRGPHSLMELSPSPPSAALGLHQVLHAHVFNSLSSWLGLSPSTRLRASHWIRL